MKRTPGTSRRRQTRQSFTERVAKELTTEAARLESEAKKMRKAAEAMTTTNGRTPR